MEGSFNFDRKVTLNAACIAQIKWWLYEGIFSGNVISHGNPDFIIQSDSSGFAWGALLLDNDNKKTQGLWNEEEAQWDINMLGVQALCKDLHHCHLQLQIDNTTAVAYINKMGGTHSLSCNAIAIELILWCKDTFG